MNTEFEAVMRSYMIRRKCKNLEQLRKKTLIGSNTTFLKKWKYPETFTVEELGEMFNYLNVPYEERFSLLGAIWGITQKG